MVDLGSVEAGERNEVGDNGCCCWERDEAAGGGPEDRGEVGANGSSKIVSVWALRVLICGTVESANHRSTTTVRTGLLIGTMKVVVWIVGGFTWVIRRMMNEFDALVLETFIKPIGTELEDIARPFPMNCAIEVIQKIHILRRETTLRGRGGGRSRRSRGRRGHGGVRRRCYRIAGVTAAQPIGAGRGKRRVAARSGEFKADWIGDGTASWEL